MFKNHTISVCCLMLAALLASSANAATVFLNPGTPGELAQDLDFGGQAAEAGPTTFLFEENKTLEYDEAGFHFFLVTGNSRNLTFTGVLLDENLVPINAVFYGQTIGENDPVPWGVISLQEPTVFRGFLLDTNLQEGVGYDINWEWDDSDRPLVGVSAIPVPAAAWLFGSGLLGLIGVARRKRAA
jgi:hypothetical protein